MLVDNIKILPRDCFIWHNEQNRSDLQFDTSVNSSSWSEIIMGEELSCAIGWSRMSILYCIVDSSTNCIICNTTSCIFLTALSLASICAMSTTQGLIKSLTSECGFISNAIGHFVRGEKMRFIKGSKSHSWSVPFQSYRVRLSFKVSASNSDSTNPCLFLDYSQILDCFRLESSSTTFTKNALWPDFIKCSNCKDILTIFVILFSSPWFDTCRVAGRTALSDWNYSKHCKRLTFTNSWVLFTF